VHIAAAAAPDGLARLEPTRPARAQFFQIRIYAATKRATRLPDDPKLAFCYDMLNKVSRSFAVVIQQLPNPLRDAICVFYLVLRGLDTVEDDMALSNRIKLPALRSFHERIYER
jgi:farnesyl-diphosphate farnesyltransferase